MSEISEINESHEGYNFTENLNSFSSEAIEYIGQREELYAEKWEELDVDERYEALVDLGNTLAEIEGTERVEVEITEDEGFDERTNEASSFLAKISYKQDDSKEKFIGEKGSFDQQERKIYINRRLLENANYRLEAIETLAHEFRHAYQYDAILGKVEHLNKEELIYWKENNEDYLTPTRVGLEGYKRQPLEVDANSYSNQARKIFDNEE